MRAIVVGSGVNGLSCAVRLRQAGYDAHVWSRDLPQRTVSAVAAAIWHPYMVQPAGRVALWGRTSYVEFARLARAGGWGVTLRSGVELLPAPAGEPSWRHDAMPFRHARPDELPARHGAAYLFDTPVVEMPIYLDRLLRALTDLGGVVEQRAVESLDEPARAAPLVVNCTGLGAREVAGDATVFPIRGQVVRVANDGRFKRFLFDEHVPGAVTYIIPRERDCVLGGTSEVGVDDLRVDPAQSRAIIDRCAAHEPALRSARIVSEAVGLRPGRPEVRLEAEPGPHGSIVIHNYGHGGAGVTLSIGCAEEVVSMAQRLSPVKRPAAITRP
jgi:D-amino-acid oxidase